MAIVNTITLTKSGSTFADVDEARADIQATINDVNYFTYMNSLKTSGGLTSTEVFNPSTQTYTTVRTFDDDVYTTWNNEYSVDVASHTTALESAGYTTSYVIA